MQVLLVLGSRRDKKELDELKFATQERMKKKVG